jgi:hypothetical protein
VTRGGGSYTAGRPAGLVPGASLPSVFLTDPTGQ